MIMAESGGTVANAFVQIMPSIEGATGSITQAIMPEVSAAGTSGGAVFGANLLGGVKGKLMGAGAAIVGALGVKTITGGLMSIGEEFDSMTDTIIVGTGASGDALDDLCDSAKSIAKQVPASFEDAGDVVQDLNTRMGMTGKDLEETGKRVIATGKLIGESVDVSKLTGSFNAFGVANEDAAAKMDYLFGVSQATGIGFNDLTGILETNAPVLQNLGFGFEQSANMAGLLDKAGMDASGTISKMSKALVNLTEPGKSVQETFQNVIGEMQGYIDKGDTAAALDIASKVFGTKGAAQFVGALQSGAFSLDDIANAALGAGDGIMGTMEATADWPEKWEILQNKAKAALEPLAGALMTGATEAMDLLGDALDGIDPETIDELGETLGGAFSDGVQVALNFAGYIIDNWPVAAGAVESVTTALQPLTQPIMDAAAEGASLLGDALGNIDPKSIEELAGTLGGRIFDGRWLPPRLRYADRGQLAHGVNHCWRSGRRTRGREGRLGDQRYRRSIPSCNGRGDRRNLPHGGRAGPFEQHPEGKSHRRHRRRYRGPGIGADRRLQHQRGFPKHRERGLGVRLGHHRANRHVHWRRPIVARGVVRRPRREHRAVGRGHGQLVVGCRRIRVGVRPERPGGNRRSLGHGNDEDRRGMGDGKRVPVRKMGGPEGHRSGRLVLHQRPGHRKPEHGQRGRF